VDYKRVIRMLVLALVALAVSAMASSLWAATNPPKPQKPLAPVAAKHINVQLVRNLRSNTWRWESLIGLRHSRLPASLYSERALRFWRARMQRARRIAAHPPHRRAWLCIHRYEGSWWDSGDAYWGGLQMDRSFMRIYATSRLLGRGWANRWTPLEQMWVAERAHRSGRGFYPWPNAARVCHLL
jgi:hypothetical protein